MSTCPHDWLERAAAHADGACALCLLAECDRLLDWQRRAVEELQGQCDGCCGIPKGCGYCDDMRALIEAVTL